MPQLTASPHARDYGSNISDSGLAMERLRVALTGAVRADGYWEDYLACLNEERSSHFFFHVAVCMEPFLQHILDGYKSMESRFSVHRVAPYRRVQAGDVLLLKRSSGPIVGLCRVRDATFYDLNPGSLAYIRATYADALCAQDAAFWERRRRASYATLMSIDHVRSVERTPFPKRDRRGWVVLPLSLRSPCPAET